MDSLKYFRLGFVGEKVQEPDKEYEAGAKAYVEVLSAINRMDVSYFKGFKDGCHLLRRYTGDDVYDLGFEAGRAAFIRICQERQEAFSIGACNTNPS
jgi:hypothetical protein